MTIRETIKQLEYQRAMFNFDPMTGDVGLKDKESREGYEACTLAIRSLEAWETVMDEIREQEYQLFDNNGTWHGGAVRIEDVEKIINKQLSEVSIKEMEKVEDKDV